MKKLFLLLFGGGILLFYIADKDAESKKEESENEVKTSNIVSKSRAKEIFNNYPLDIIPYQISGTNYVLPVRIISVSSKRLKNAFTKQHDEYTVDGYEDGMNVKVKYSLKNPYHQEMWIPIPSKLTLTSNDYPLEDDYRKSKFHSHKDYDCLTPNFVSNEPHYKSDAFERLYYFAPADSIILLSEFNSLPYTENIIVCGITVSENDKTYEKGVLINTKQNAIIEKVVFNENKYY